MSLRFHRTARTDYFKAMTPGWILGASLYVGCILFVFWLNRSQGKDLLLCPLRLCFGVPCPLCGGTTATMALVSGDFTGALRANPLVALSVILFTLWTLVWLGFGVRIGTTLNPALATSLLLLLLALNWAFLASTKSQGRESRAAPLSKPEPIPR